MMGHVQRLSLLGTLLTLAMLAPYSVHADPVECSASMSTINFGTVDPTQPGATDVSATLSWSCTSQVNDTYYATVCFNINDGPLGLNAGRRQIAGPGGNLGFQIYSNASRTNVWGAIGNAVYPTPVRVDTSRIRGNRTVSGTVPVYARLFGGQGAASVGTYASTFSNPQVRISGLLSTYQGGGDCGSEGDDAGYFSPMTITANIAPTCTVTANDMNFGSAGLLAGNHDATSTINVTCVDGTSYNVGLDNGLHANGNTRRMQGNGGLITYELYRNANRTQRWGHVPGTDTVNGNGNGGTQTFTVRGRVPAQTTPSAGTYNDTVTVNVTY